jgi:hypothetical protein
MEQGKIELCEVKVSEKEGQTIIAEGIETPLPPRIQFSNQIFEQFNHPPGDLRWGSRCPVCARLLPEPGASRWREKAGS